MHTTLLKRITGLLALIGAAFSLVIILIVVLDGLPTRPRLTPGTVVGYERELTEQGLDSLRYFPLVDYTNTAGEPRSFRSRTGLVQPDYATGAVVRVVYSPSENPKHRRAEIISSASWWAAGSWLFWVLAIVSFLSVIPLVITAYAFLNQRKIREVISSLRPAPKMPLSEP